MGAKIYLDATEQRPIGKSSSDLPKECSTELDIGLEVVEVSMADAADSWRAAKRSECLSLVGARSLLLLSSTAEPPLKRARVESTAALIHEGSSRLRVGSAYGASFTAIKKEH